MRPATGAGFLLALVACAMLAALELRAPPYADLYWQLPEGAQILAGHFPSTVPYALDAGRWVDHEWLFEVLAAFCRRHGAYAVFAIACDLAFAAYPLFLYALLRRRYGDLACGGVALLAAAGLFFTNPYRPQTIAYYCFSLVANELDAEHPRWWRAALAALVWANVHGSAVLVPLLGAIYAAGAWKARVPPARMRAIAVGATAATLATLLTPHGIGLWRYAVDVAYAPFTQYIREWRPLGFDEPEARYVFAPVVALLVAGGLRVERNSATQLMLAAAFVTSAALHVRHVAFLVPATATLLAATLERFAVVRRATVWPPLGRLQLAPARAAVAAVVAFGVLVGAGLGGGAGSTVALALGAPGPAADAVALARFAGADAGAYVDRPYAAALPFAGLPTRLLIDSHADPYDAAVWADADALEQLKPSFREVLGRRTLTLLILDRDSPLAQAMPYVAGWRVAASRGRWIAFVRARANP